MDIYLNLTGAFFVILSSWLFSNMLIHKENEKTRNLRAVAEAYGMIAADIRMGFSNLPDAFLNVSEKTYDEKTRKFFREMADEMIRQNEDDVNIIVNICADRIFAEAMTARELELIKDFGRIPVCMDASLQINYIDELVSRLREQISCNVISGAAKKKVYYALSLSCAITLVIILV